MKEFTLIIKTTTEEATQKNTFKDLLLKIDLIEVDLSGISNVISFNIKDGDKGVGIKKVIEMKCNKEEETPLRIKMTSRGTQRIFKKNSSLKIILKSGTTLSLIGNMEIISYEETCEPLDVESSFVIK